MAGITMTMGGQPGSPFDDEERLRRWLLEHPDARQMTDADFGAAPQPSQMQPQPPQRPTLEQLLRMALAGY